MSAVRLAGAGLLILTVLTGCARSTEGSVAMTTEPGPPLTTEPSTTRAPGIPGLPEITIPGLPDIELPDITVPGLDPELPEVPAPANSTTMTCDEYNGLDAATKAAVIRAILGEQQSNVPPEIGSVMGTVADVVCQIEPNATVAEVLLGGPVP